ncbi:MAG: hypothetical protein ACT4TC_00400, partial [Myxococcaceae bacterium]
MGTFLGGSALVVPVLTGCTPPGAALGQVPSVAEVAAHGAMVRAIDRSVISLDGIDPPTRKGILTCDEDVVYDRRIIEARVADHSRAARLQTDADFTEYVDSCLKILNDAADDVDAAAPELPRFRA